MQKGGVHCPDALGQGCKDPKPLRPTSSCSVLAGVLTD